MTLTDTRTAYFTDAASVDSSVISDVYYDRETEVLFVRLNSTGRLAGYRGVPAYVYEALTNGRNSAGQYWNYYVKNQYSGVNGDVALTPREAETQDAELSDFANSPTVETVRAADFPELVDTDKIVGVGTVNKYGVTRTFLVTVAVQAADVSAAVNAVASQGLEVRAVNPQ